MMGKSYLELISRILADSGFAITIVGPDGPIVGTKADILAIDDMPDMDRAAKACRHKSKLQRASAQRDDRSGH